MSFFNNPFKQDTYHYFGKDKVDFKHLLKDHGYRYVFYLRQCQAGGWRKLIFSIPRKHLSLRHGIEISPEVRCGGGGCTLDTLTESRSAPGRCLG